MADNKPKPSLIDETSVNSNNTTAPDPFNLAALRLPPSFGNSQRQEDGHHRAGTKAGQAGMDSRPSGEDYRGDFATIHLKAGRRILPRRARADRESAAGAHDWSRSTLRSTRPASYSFGRRRSLRSEQPRWRHTGTARRRGGGRGNEAADTGRSNTRSGRLRDRLLGQPDPGYRPGVAGS